MTAEQMIIGRMMASRHQLAEAIAFIESVKAKQEQNESKTEAKQKQNRSKMKAKQKQNRICILQVMA